MMVIDSFFLLILGALREVTKFLREIVSVYL